MNHAYCHIKFNRYFNSYDDDESSSSSVDDQYEIHASKDINSIFIGNFECERISTDVINIIKKKVPFTLLYLAFSVFIGLAFFSSIKKFLQIEIESPASRYLISSKFLFDIPTGKNQYFLDSIKNFVCKFKSLFSSWP
ncbi:hypothetical protein M9Y10_035152 [Tritrichomonas musculus]|uniref:Uncharacterized protein n=1 Tax=Tritrichomonas musculus TaxID=1915356 RepID=A0ABR2KHY8_9EUKA